MNAAESSTNGTTESTVEYNKYPRRNKTTKWYLVKFGVILCGLLLAVVLSELRMRMGLHETEDEQLQLRNILATTGSEDQDTCPGIKGNTDEDRCEFVRANCPSDGFINYLEFYYCKCSNAKWLAFVIFIAWLIVLFYMLGHTAEEFFCPTLSKISLALQLAPDVAGITILALGNGSPDLFSIFAAVNSGQSGIATGEILGSGNFITTVVIGLVACSAKVTVPWSQLIRDVGFYLFAITLACFIVYNGEVYVWQPILALLFYISYVLFSIAINYCGNRSRYDGSRRGGLMFQDGDESLIGGEEYIDDYDDEDSLIQMQEFTKSSDLGGDDDDVSGPSELETAIHQMEASPKPRRKHSKSKPSLLEQIGVIESTIDTSEKVDHELVYRTAKGLHRWEVQHKHRAYGADDVLGVSDMYESQKTTFHPEEEEVQEEANKTFKAFMLQRLQRLKEYVAWEEKSVFDKIVYVATWPLTVWLNLSIPNVERWSRTLRIANPIVSPIIFMFAADAWSAALLGVPVWTVVFTIGFVISVFIYFTAERGRPPRFQGLWMLIAFLMCITWIFLIANELVNVLQSMGLILKISQTVLGLTVLAWGNSVGDMIADVVVAKEGFPEMAVAACFGGPLFNMLNGLGISFTWACFLSMPSPYIVKMTTQILLSFIFLGLSLLSTIIVVPLCGFVFPKKYAVYLFLLYGCCTVTNLLVELQVFKLHV